MIGIGRYELLKNIQKTSSLKISAEKCGLASKTAYNYIKRIESRLGERIITSKKGGKAAGGSTNLNGMGLQLISEYEAITNKLK